MKRYEVKIDTDALQDIQDATNWYNNEVPGLGVRFQKQVKEQIKLLKSDPTIYAKRYQDVHCMLIKKFPFLVHFVIDHKNLSVDIFAVTHTSRNPKIWEEKRNKQ